MNYARAFHELVQPLRMKAPSQYPEAQDFASAIAKPFDGDAFGAIAREFGLSWSDADRLASELQVYMFPLQELGIRFTFEDQGVLLKREHHQAGEGPFVLTKCTFWGHQDEAKMYQGPLWGELSFDDSVDTAKRKLGEQAKVNPRSGLYSWEFPEFKLTIQWVDAEKIRVVTYWMKQS